MNLTDLKDYLDRMPETASASAVSFVAHALWSADYERKAADARRNRDWTLAKGYSQLADDVLAAVASDREEHGREVAELRKRTYSTTGAMRQGYLERAEQLEGNRVGDVPPEFVAEARQLVKAAGLADSRTNKRARQSLAGLVIEKANGGTKRAVSPPRARVIHEGGWQW